MSSQWEMFPRWLFDTVTERTTSSFPIVMNLVRGRPGMVRLELLAAYCWITTHRIGTAFPEQFAKAFLDTFHAYLFEFYRNRGLDGKHLEKLLHCRYREYRIAWKAEVSSDSMLDVCNYFTACCNSTKLEVAFERIIPDPKDFQHIADLYTPETMRTLVLLAGKGAPCYRVHAEAVATICQQLGGLADVINRRIEELRNE